ncbi:MAG TPA: GNAT family N-acetyltransferase [Bacteroidia bacterium]
MSQLSYTAKSFNELTPHELYAILKLRCEIFVVEQNCLYVDPDGKDQECFHVLAYLDGKMLAYTRLVPAGVSYDDSPSIGRVVIDAAFRDRKWGYELMEYSMKKCEELFGTKKITISAQYHLQHFYEKCGFKAIGEVYMEDDIPHIKMKTY